MSQHWSVYMGLRPAQAQILKEVKMKPAILWMIVLSAGVCFGQKNRKPECTKTGPLSMVECERTCWAYKCVDGKIVVDEDATSKMREASRENARAKRDMVHALVTRVLTPAEMAEILDMGSDLFIPDGQPYYPEEISKKFQAALEIQKTLRQMEIRPCK